MGKKPIVKIENLQVTFNHTKVLDLKEKIEIQNGDVVGIVGENGAGKTTFINSIINQVNYTGEIECNFLKDELGIQFQNNSYNQLMKVFELIQIVTQKSKYDDKITQLLKSFELQELLNKKIGKLSGGEKQRLTLFLVLYLEPKILFFDELTTGLDFQKRSKLLKIIKNYSKGKTVLTISHYFEEFNNWVNKLLILHKGRLVFFGEISELKNKFPHNSILKINKNSRDILGKINDQDLKLEIIKEFDDGIDAVVIREISDLSQIIDLFSEYGIVYEMIPCSIYTLYALAINSLEGSE